MHQTVEKVDNPQIRGMINVIDYLLKVAVPDLSHYRDFCLHKLLSIKGVASVQSSFVLESVIDKTALPLDHLN